MSARDFAVSLIHSEMSQVERNMCMKEFRNGATRVLIATDVICRGIDVQQVSIVVNFDIPRDYANYIHRIGRGGRLGRKAVAINLVCTREVQALREIEAYYKHKIDELPADIAALL